jgi:uncharacterized protein DUF6062
MRLSKPLAYHELLEGLKLPGCAVCRSGAATARRYLESLCWEFINDPPVRSRLRKSLGFCRGHAYQLDAQASRLAVAILYEDLLRTLEAELQSALKPRRRPAALSPCPACEAVEGQEQSTLQVLADFIEDPAVADAYRDSAGLCRPHMLALCRRLPETSRRRVVAEEQLRLQTLLGELAEVKRKSDYRSANEAWGDERTAPTRAIAKLVGEPDES